MKNALILICILFFYSAFAQMESKIDKLTVGNLKLPKESISKATYIDSNGQIKSSDVTDVELNFMSGVTSGIQGQLDAKEPSLPASTTASDYLRGDKTFQLLDKSSVGLSNVDNTSDDDKPISSDTQTALNLKSDDDAVVHLSGSETITGNKLFTGQLTATSTTKGNRPCPVMTPTERDAIVSPSLGDCIINSVSYGLETFDGTIWKETGGGGGGISNWATATSYVIGDVVIESNKIYQANTAHSSTVFSSQIANWTQIANNVSDSTGVLPIVNGGTNSNSPLSGSSIIVSDGTKLIQGEAGTSTTLLHGNASGSPTYSAASLTSDVSGVLPLLNGGTNKAMTAINGGIVYSDADSQEVSSSGSIGQILNSNGESAPTWVNKSILGKSQDGSSVTMEELQVPNNLLTATASNKYLNETGNKNILSNPSFEHSTFSTSWTNSAGTFTQELSTVIDGKASAKVVLSSETMALTQSSTLYASQFADGTQGLVSARIKTDVPLKLCAIKAGVVSTTDCLDIIGDNKWGHFQVPTILGSTSNGLSIESNGNVSGQVYIDDTYVGTSQPFVSAPLITEWVDFPSVAAGVLITGTTTNPTYGTVATNKAQWRRVGSNMEIRWDYRQTTAGLIGSGNYLFNLPPGYQIDTSKVAINTSIGSTSGAGFDSQSLGTISMTYTTTASAGGIVSAYSSTQLKGWLNSGAASAVWGASGLDFAQATAVSFGIKASVPILGWSSSINTITQQCQNDAECANEFSAKISSTDVVSSETLDWIDGDCTNATAGQATCIFKTGIFTNAPNCGATWDNSSTSGSQYVQVVSTTSSQVIFRTTINGTGTNSSFSVYCQKSGTDYKARRAIVGSFKQITDMPQTKAYTSFDGSTLALLSGTYSRNLTTVTVTATAHGHKVGHKVYLDFTSGAAVDGLFDVVSVPDENTFTVTHGTSGATSGNVNLNRITLISSRNVQSVYRQATGVYWVNFTDFMNNTNYVVSGNTWVSGVPRDMAGLPSATGHFYVETATSGVGNTQGNPVTAIVTQ